MHDTTAAAIWPSAKQSHLDLKKPHMNVLAMLQQWLLKMLFNLILAFNLQPFQSKRATSTEEDYGHYNFDHRRLLKINSETKVRIQRGKKIQILKLLKWKS